MISLRNWIIASCPDGDLPAWLQQTINQIMSRLEALEAASGAISSNFLDTCFLQTYAFYIEETPQEPPQEEGTSVKTIKFVESLPLLIPIDCTVVGMFPYHDFSWHTPNGESGEHIDGTSNFNLMLAQGSTLTLKAMPSVVVPTTTPITFILKVANSLQSAIS